MKICLVGLDNLPVLAPEYRGLGMGGETVQQTLLARALARRGHEVSMVVSDQGQEDGARWHSIRTFKAFRPNAGIPVLRFIHPRWTGMWSALKRADADVYYTSCAGMQVGLIALFCWRHRRRLVFRTASDTDCDPSRLLLKYARDRWLYDQGLRRADAILVQSVSQANDMALNYGLKSRVAGMLVEAPGSTAVRDIEVLWVSNIQHLKRPDRLLQIADCLPDVQIHMVGGPMPGQESIYRQIKDAAETRPNVVFHGRLSYWDTNALYDRAKLLVNTSDVEGFPNSYLQSWIRGVPVVTLLDPDRVIEREGLGAVARSPADLAGLVQSFLLDADARQAASDRCRRFMAREFGEEKILSAYLDTFQDVLHRGLDARVIPTSESTHG